MINKKEHKFRVVEDCTYSLIMSNNIFRIRDGSGGVRAVPCIHNGKEVFAKAKHLHDQVRYFQKMTCGFTHTFRCTPYRSPCTVHNESDDEDIDVPELQPEFDADYHFQSTTLNGIQYMIFILRQV